VAADFTLLGRAAVTCTDGTVTGNVGDSVPAPAGAVTLTTCPLTGGTAHIGDAAARAAYNAFLGAYTSLAPQAGDCDAAHTLLSTITGPVTLAPGVYCTGAALTGAGVLTLSGPASGTWLFKIGTLGTGALTGTGFNVVMAGGADACNVTWWVSQAVTMTDSDLKGTILAGAAITLTRGTLLGRAFSQAGVTVTGTAVTGCVGGVIGGGGDGRTKRRPYHPPQRIRRASSFDSPRIGRIARQR
jgi:Ice-binding-like